MGRYYAPPPPPPAGIDDVERIMWTVLVIFLVVLLILKKGPSEPKSSTRPKYSNCLRFILTPERMTSVLRQVDLLNTLGEPEIEKVVHALEARTFKAGEVIYRQDEQGEDC